MHTHSIHVLKRQWIQLEDGSRLRHESQKDRQKENNHSLYFCLFFLFLNSFSHLLEVGAPGKSFPLEPTNSGLPCSCQRERNVILNSLSTLLMSILYNLFWLALLAIEISRFNISINMQYLFPPPSAVSFNMSHIFKSLITEICIALRCFQVNLRNKVSLHSQLPRCQN